MSTIKYDIVFIATYVEDVHIDDLVCSIIENNNTLKVLLLVLCQNGYRLNKRNTTIVDMITISIPDKVGLSKARNICLQYICEKNIKFRYAMFPDDDSLFDQLFFNNFRDCVSGNTLIAVKATQDRKSYFIKMPNKQIATTRDYKYAISVNMVITWQTLQQTGAFDENLGVGCYYGAGEDNDYFIRCSKIEPFLFNNGIWNYHPLQKNLLPISIDLLVHRYKAYGRGVVYMLMKHKLYSSALITVLRGYIGAILNMLTLNLKMSYVYFVAANERLRIFTKKIMRLC